MNSSLSIRIVDKNSISPDILSITILTTLSHTLLIVGRIVSLKISMALTPIFANEDTSSCHGEASPSMLNIFLIDVQAPSAPFTIVSHRFLIVSPTFSHLPVSRASATELNTLLNPLYNPFPLIPHPAGPFHKAVATRFIVNPLCIPAY